MQVTDRTRKVLENYVKINPSIIFYPGNEIVTMKDDKCLISVAQVDETFEMECGIYNLGELLRVLKLHNDPSLDWQEKMVVISDNVQTTKYLYTSPEIAKEIIASPGEKRIKLKETHVSFSLSGEILKKLKDTSAIMNLFDVKIACDGTEHYMELFDQNNPTSSTSKITLDIEPTSSYSMVFDINNWIFMIQDYDVRINTDMHVAEFEGESIKYWATAKVS